MVRFLHTADWQLGMPARFLNDEAAVRFAADRLAAVRSLGRLAGERSCDFVLVCGDVFDSNLVSRKTVHQAVQALAEIPVPVYLLPANHDPLGPATVYRRDEFRGSLPAHIHVLEDAGLVPVAPGVEIVAAPWTSKRPADDLVASACQVLTVAAEGTIRILAGHGAVDVWTPGGAIASTAIRLASVEGWLTDGLLHYVALGDRHSVTNVGATGRIWYSGTPEVTDFGEQDAGQVLLVEVDDQTCQVQPQRVGRWHFVRRQMDVTGTAGVDALAFWLEELRAKSETVVRLELTGTLGLAEYARLTALQEKYGDILAGLELAADDQHLAVRPTEFDFENLGLGGFAVGAVAQLRAQAGSADAGAQKAQDALELLYRLAGRDRA